MLNFNQPRNKLIKNNLLLHQGKKQLAMKGSIFALILCQLREFQSYILVAGSETAPLSPNYQEEQIKVVTYALYKTIRSRIYLFRR